VTLAEEVEAIEVGHMEVGNHGIKMTAVKFPQGLQSIRDRHRRKVVHLQILHEQMSYMFLIVND